MIGPEMDTDEHGQPCALPSLVRVPVYVLSSRGVSLWQIIESCVEDGMHTHLPGKRELLRFKP